MLLRNGLGFLFWKGTMMYVPSPDSFSAKTYKLHYNTLILTVMMRAAKIKTPPRHEVNDDRYDLIFLVYISSAYIHIVFEDYFDIIYLFRAFTLSQSHYRHATLQIHSYCAQHR